MSGMVKLPSQMATWLSPKGSVKKHNLYSRQPSAWRRRRRCHTRTEETADAKMSTHQTTGLV